MRANRLRSSEGLELFIPIEIYSGLYRLMWQQVEKMNKSMRWATVVFWSVALNLKNLLFSITAIIFHSTIVTFTHSYTDDMRLQGADLLIRKSLGLSILLMGTSTYSRGSRGNRTGHPPITVWPAHLPELQQLFHDLILYSTLAARLNKSAGSTWRKICRGVRNTITPYLCPLFKPFNILRFRHVVTPCVL